MTGVRPRAAALVSGLLAATLILAVITGTARADTAGADTAPADTARAVTAAALARAPLARSAAVVPVPRYPSTPPAGITCRTVALGSVTLSCLIGHSVAGRAIVAVRQGNPAAARVLLVSGQMHGEEWPGPRVVDVLRSLAVSPTGGAQVWTVRTMNPDGGARGRRFTNHGVDLNANFPAGWTRAGQPGPRPLSEPESQAMARLLTWIEPDLVVSLHGFSTSVDTTGGGLRAARARWFSRLTTIGPAHPVPCDGPCHGNMTDWYTATSKVQGVAFTVEMPRTSRVVRACAVPGHPRGSTLQCAAWAAAYLAPRLPA